MALFEDIWVRWYQVHSFIPCH